MTRYFLRDLLPKREKAEPTRPLWEVLKGLTWTQWGIFTSDWLARTCDGIDFYVVPLTVVSLQQQFDRSTNDITTSITLTLLFRAAGAVIFGLLSDRYGRKWPLVVDLLLLSILTLGSGLVQTFHQFLAVRSLLGIGMGGIWGLTSAASLENVPVEVRGIASGVLNLGHVFGYLLASIISLYLVPHTTWRALFWTASGISAFSAVVRALLPESEVFLRARKEEKFGSNVPAQSKTRIFVHEVGQMLKHHWRRCIYVVMLTSGFGFLSHGSQDLYPTYLQVNKGFTKSDAAIATIIGNCGAAAGGVFIGGLSQYIGRRLAIIVSALLIGVFIPLWIIPNTFDKLSAGAFCVQFGIQGGFGVLSIFLSEISPPAFRATFTGVTYQMGNMVSSASAQIEATGGEHLRTTTRGPNGLEDVPNYAFVQGIFIGCVAAYIIVLVLLSPENHGSHFERSKVAFQAGASKEDLDLVPEEIEQVRDVERSSGGGEGIEEKEDTQHIENERPVVGSLP